MIKPWSGVNGFESLMRIGALAKATDLSRDTIRFYERHGLISSAPSTSETNSYRNYPDDSVERLQMITDARDAGLSVADLSLLLDAVEHGGQPDFDFEEFIKTRIAQLDHVIATARKTRNMLRLTQKAIKVSETDYSIANSSALRSIDET